MIGDNITINDITLFVKTNKRLVVYVSIIAVFVILTVWFTPMQIKTFLVLGKKNKELKKEIVKVEEEIKSRSRVLSDQEELKNQINEFKNKILTSQDISGLQAYISAKAKDNNMEIVEIEAAVNPQLYKSTSYGKFFHLPIRIKLKCGFHNLGRFLNDIEKSDYSLAVSSLSIIEGKSHNEVGIEIMALTQ